jgi:hypothetical protein
MSNRVLLSVALLGLLLGCGDEGPEVPILFVSPPAGSNGAGRVTSSPTGIDCTISNQTSTGVCSANFEAGTIVTLSANSSAGSAFTAWGEACTGAIATCEVTLDDSKDVTAQFTLANPRTLTVAGAGTGNGTIISTPGGLSCAFNGAALSGTCTADFADGAVVTLSALPVAGSGFATWGGDCAGAAGSGTCDLTMSAARNATAQFVSVSFSGLLASAGDDQSGLIVVSIPVASASVGRTSAGRGVSFSAAQVEIVAVGSYRFLGREQRTVAGTYNTETQVLSLSSASGFGMTASFSGQAFDGLFFDAETSIGGPSTLLAASGTTPAAAYCGTFTGGDSGTWNVVIVSPRVSATRSNPNGSARSMVGDLSDRTITLDAYNGTPPESNATGTATGTLSADGTSITGTWADFSEATGTWQATTAACD